MSIYTPEADSYLLQDVLEKYLKNKFDSRKIKNPLEFLKEFTILDMGTGSGIQAETCIGLSFTNITVADINRNVIKQLKGNKKFKLYRIKRILTDLFSNIPETNKFNLIIFNPPYLPRDKREPLDSQLNTTAGEKGYEIIFRFLKQAKNYLKNQDSSILLLFSSLSQPDVILKKADKLNYKYKLLKSEKWAFEEIFIYEFKIQ